MHAQPLCYCYRVGNMYVRTKNTDKGVLLCRSDFTDVSLSETHL